MEVMSGVTEEFISVWTAVGTQLKTTVNQRKTLHHASVFSLIAHQSYVSWSLGAVQRKEYVAVCL